MLLNTSWSKIVLGSALVIFGVVIIIYGEKEVSPEKGPFRLSFYPSEYFSFLPKIWKWILGVLLMCVGIGLMTSLLEIGR